jgi:hypothetical protein
MTPMRQGSGWRKTWDMIIPGDFNGDGKTNLLFYDRESGDYEFYRVNDNGSMTLTLRGSGWRKTWDMIIPDAVEVKPPVKPPDNGGTNPNPNYVYRDVDYLRALYQDNVGNQASSNTHTHDHIIREAFDTLDGDPDGRVHALVGGEVVSAKNGKYSPSNDWIYNGEVAIYNKELNKTFIYWHFAEGSVNTSLKGRTIKAGDFIGIEGNTGASDGAHTHVQIHEGRGPNYAQSARLHIPTVFEEAVRRGLVKL